MQDYFKFVTRAIALTTILTGLSFGAATAQTPEGTVITNTATATFSDANNNVYAAVNASVSVTVGFQAGIDVIPPTGPFNPASPSTGNTLDFYVKNVGNGTDGVTISEVIGTPTVITVTGYLYNAVNYANLGLLNAALGGAADSIVQGDSIAIQVIYDVPAGQGGNNTDYTLTATSNRDVGTSDSELINIAINAAFGVAVTPDAPTPVSQLPSVPPTGPIYSQIFAVQNTGNAPDSYTLVASTPGVLITNIALPGGSPIGPIAVGASINVTVQYQVDSTVAAGSTGDLILTATSVGDVGQSDAGTINLTRVTPAITMTKEVFRADSLTAIGAGTVVPGEVIWYRITVTNSGSADADPLSVADVLPGQVTYISNVPDVAADWTIVEAAGTVTADFLPGGAAGPLSVGVSRHFWIQVSIN